MVLVPLLWPSYDPALYSAIKTVCLQNFLQGLSLLPALGGILPALAVDESKARRKQPQRENSRDFASWADPIPAWFSCSHLSRELTSLGMPATGAVWAAHPWLWGWQMALQQQLCPQWCIYRGAVFIWSHPSPRATLPALAAQTQSCAGDNDLLGDITCAPAPPHSSPFHRLLKLTIPQRIKSLIHENIYKVIAPYLSCKGSSNKQTTPAPELHLTRCTIISTHVSVFNWCHKIYTYRMPAFHRICKTKYNV